ncbi:unnamed protein product [Echinostoma caproni]|uniref:Pseudouridylate synthase RPUSD4, mitochondrial n=1 Tax=Echinostoma caproni TaxID=27848 RepID=A0A183AL70_9TREM|nr:unnamed protein product [Echinostoma caproni]
MEDARRELDILASSVSPFGMCFAPAKCKLMLQDWVLSSSVLKLDGQELAEVDCSYLAGPGHKYSVVQLLPRIAHLARTHPTAIGVDDAGYQIVHRLDKECSGLMLIARNTDTSLRLQEAFAKRWIRKDYLCITVGIPQQEKGYLRLPITERSFNGVHKVSD